MGLLTGKRALIMGLANDNSIAWGISKALHAEGAELCFTFVGEALEKRVRPLAASLGTTFVEPCDVASDSDITNLFARIKEVWGTFDILIHAVAFAKKDELNGDYLNVSREGFHIAMDISVYSLTGVIKAARPLINSGGSIITLTYHGSQQVAQNYNVMGVAKAALEASVRYLASDLGPQNIRVNAISAGPIRTLAASGIAGFKDLLKSFAGVAPLRRNVTQEDVGNTALFLASDLSSATTGEIIYVDAGFRNISIKTE
ncbi:MAG: enoyl-ACP reductase [Chloroflexi bacterium]|nr:MAG: enoyl-ACP reductase [Chloroflexota bacterium]